MPTSQPRKSTSLTTTTTTGVTSQHYQGVMSSDVRLCDIGFDVEREIEKARIRREILLEESMRRQVLEAQVRREMMMMREIAIARGGNSVPIDAGIGPKYGHLPYIGGWTGLCAAGAGDRAKAALDKDAFIKLPRPKENFLGTKRTAVAQPALGNEKLQNSSKKPKSEWTCAICQVTANSYKILQDHLEGRRHKVKEARVGGMSNVADGKFQMMGSSSTSDNNKNDHMPHIKQHAVSVHEQVKSAGLKDKKTEASQTGAASEKVMESPKEVMPRFMKGELPFLSDDDIHFISKKPLGQWNCTLCQVTATSKISLERHLNGKRHIKGRRSVRLSKTTDAYQAVGQRVEKPEIHM